MSPWDSETCARARAVNGGGTSPKIHPKAAGSIGDSTLTLNVTGGTGPTLTGTLVIGDYIAIGSNPYMITKAATAAANEG